MKSVLFAMLVAALSACATSVQGERYRGGYTFGHEVRTFCPEINSQCYWLGPGTPAEVREQLNSIYKAKKPGLYKPVCVVVEGKIDRDSPRDGFAADYDGLIDITAVQGACDDGAMLVPGDLNHRRWVLAERDGVTIVDDAAPVVLDFGERLFVEITDGCQRLSGFAVIDGDRLRLDGLDADASACGGDPPNRRLFSDRLVWQAALVGDGLRLRDGDTHLAFRRDDWR